MGGALRTPSGTFGSFGHGPSWLSVGGLGIGSEGGEKQRIPPQGEGGKMRCIRTFKNLVGKLCEVISSGSRFPKYPPL